MDERTLRVEDDQGKTYDYEILFTFTSERTNKSYVIFKEPGDSEELFAYIYNEADTEGGKLMPVETDEEWDEIEAKIDQYFEENETE